MIELRSITANSVLYEQQSRLRQVVLFDHVSTGVEREIADRFEGEDEATHVVAVPGADEELRVVGCLSLLRNGLTPRRVKLTRLAVDAGNRGMGIGRTLVREAERRAFAEIGATELFCHARRGSYGFYESLGWKLGSATFIEDGIEHRVMRSAQLK